MQKSDVVADDGVIAFHVNYRLAEYLSIVSAHSVVEAARQQASQGKTLSRLGVWTVRCSVYLFVPPIFMLKVLTVGACDFRIDATGIARNSKSGPVTVPWASLVAIHEYPAGYLFAKSNGAMPVPYRVLTAGQRLALDAYVIRYRQGATGQGSNG